MTDTYVIPRARQASVYGHVIGSIGVWDDGEAALLQRVLERSLRETTDTVERGQLLAWRRELMVMRDRAQRHSWRGWERR